MPGLTRALFWAVLLAGTLATVACAPMMAVYGNKPDADALAELKPGEDNRDDVTDRLGSPSSISTFKPETWLYISKRTETIAFLEPELMESSVVALTFDDQGMLRDIKILSAENQREITPVERTTPTSGNEMGVLEQLLGNFGRFSSGESTSRVPSQ